MPTVKYARLPSQGVIYGIDRVGLVTLVAAVLVATVGVVKAALLGFVLSGVIWLPLVLLAVVKLHGETLMAHLVREVIGRGRKQMGMNKYVARPEKRTLAEVGQLNLPGRNGKLHLWQAANGSAVIFDARDGLLSVTCVVATPGLDGASPETVAERVHGWAGVQGALAQKEYVERLSVSEQTRPGTVAAERRAYATTARSGNTAVHESYREALRLAGERVVMHRTQITLTLNAGKGEGRRIAKANGGGKLGMLALAELEMESTTDALARAGFTKVKWINAREWAAWGSSIVDPAGQQGVDLRIGTQWEGVDPEGAAPMYIADERTWVETDSAVHRTFWIGEFPRMETHPGFLSKIIFARTGQGASIRHTFTLVAHPVNLREAMKKVDEQKRTWITNATLRQKAGRPESAADAADWHAIEAHEQALVAGQGELKFSAYMTVTAPTKDELERNSAALRNAASMAGLEPRVMVWTQAEALLNVAFPAGGGIK